MTATDASAELAELLRIAALRRSAYDRLTRSAQDAAIKMIRDQGTRSTAGGAS